MHQFSLLTFRPRVLHGCPKVLEGIINGIILRFLSSFCIVYSTYLFNGVFYGLRKKTSPSTSFPVPNDPRRNIASMWPKHEKRSWTTRDNARMSAIPQWDVQMSRPMFPAISGPFPWDQVSPICFLFIYQLDLSTWFEMGCILVVWVGALKSWNLFDLFQVHWVTIDLDSF